MATWLNDAVFYEIYPQTFCDTNGDGIGDLQGIISKLDYVKSVGCNAIWMNPCYDSPFTDAGYDVRDYKKIAARYGTMDDMLMLFDEVHKRDMHILLDLVPGHTSEEHPWFLESKKAEVNEYSDRYIWTDFWMKGGEGLNFVAGETQRNGAYITNFFKCQPALNFGFLNPTESWHKAIDDPACLQTREAICDIMRFWLQKGCDGFRVDMADSLVKKDDEHKSGTVLVWQDILGKIKKEFPEAAFVSEWGRPDEAIKAGFDMDFNLNWFGNGYSTLFRDYDNHRAPFGQMDEHEGADLSYFKKDSGGSVDHFLDEFAVNYPNSKGGHISLITGNHDTPRLGFSLGQEELKLAYAFLFTMPGNPFLYYGDEIGMHYLDVETKEGGFTRTGSRTPMQWNHDKNFGFSTADAKDLYLPVDTAADAPCVADQEADDDSLLNTLREVLKLRHSESDLIDYDNFEVISREPFVYKRGSLYMCVNPHSKASTFAMPAKAGKSYEDVYSIGEMTFAEDTIQIKGPGFMMIREK